MLVGVPGGRFRMFVRTVPQRKTGHRAVQVVESYRNQEGKPRQRVIAYLGCVPPGPALDELLRLAELRKAEEMERSRRHALFPPQTLAEAAFRARHGDREERPLPIADARRLREDRRVVLGIHEVFGALYAQLGLSEAWGTGARKSEGVFRQAVLIRLAEPGRSKRAQALRLGRDYGIPLDLGKLYRMMDRLDAGRIKALCGRVESRVASLLDGRVDVAFLDVTTLAFASEKDDELRKRGYSKDGKPHRVQVVLALLQTTEGLPLGYRLFAGNTAEVKTLQPMVEELRARYPVRRLVVVTDAAMASRENLETLEAEGFAWVVAARLRKLPEKELQAVEATLRAAREPSAGPAPGEARAAEGWLADHTVGTGPMKGRRLVTHYSPKRARKDARDRAHALERARKRLAAGVKGRGRAGRFIKVRKGALSINDAAVVQDARFDGLHGLWTSLEDPALEVRARYAELWRIEHGFRVLKHTLAVRPVFHWTERRVRAHVAICFLAFALLRIFRWRYGRQHPTMPLLSEERILDELTHVEASTIRDPTLNKHYLLPSSSNAEQRMLYATVGLHIPRQLVPYFPP